MAFDLAELQFAIETISDLYYVLSQDGVFEFINQAGIEFFKALLGDVAASKHSTLIGANSRELDLPLDWLAIHERGRHMALKTGEPAIYETPVAIANQTYCYEFTFTSLTHPGHPSENVLVVGRDVTRYHQLAQDQSLTTLLSIQKRLTESDPVHPQYEPVLQQLGEVFDADRAYILEACSEDTHPLLFSMLAEWCSPNVTVDLHRPIWQNIPLLDYLPALKAYLENGRPAVILTDELPPKQRQFFQPSRVRSILLLPLIIESRILGVIGFENYQEAREWSTAEKTLLQVAAVLISTRMHQFKAEVLKQQWLEELTHNSRQMQAVFQAFPDLVFRLGADGTYLEWQGHLDYLYAPPQEIVGRRVQDVIPEPLGEHFYQMIQDTLNQGGMSQYEYDLDVLNGTHYFETRMVPFQPDQVLAIVRNITDRKQLEKLLNRVVEGTAAVGGQDFFEALVEHMAIALDVHYVAVQEITGDQVNVLAFWNGDRLEECLEYDIQNTPCEQVIVQGWYHCAENVQQLFPQDEVLQEMGVESYAGYALTNADSQPIGLLCVLDDKPFVPSLAAVSVLKVFAVRATMELQRQRAEQALRQKAQQEQALNRVVQSIRNSLDLETTFATAVAEVQQLLTLKEATILEYLPDCQTWQAIATYSEPSHEVRSPKVGTEYPDPNAKVVAHLRQFEIIHHDYSCSDIHANPGLAFECPNTAWMIVPLATGDRIWGVLHLVQDSEHSWDDTELAIAQTIADHLSIAIQQAELYQQVQQMNASLETQVRERTMQLERALDFEDLLRRITDKVRDSLDEQTIFHATAKELADGLDLRLCNIVLYDGRSERSDPIALVLQGAYGNNAPIQQPLLPFADYSELYSQLTQGWIVQLCVQVDAEILSPHADWFSVFLCPIADDHGVIGDLLLLRDKTCSFNSREMRLVEQVASQCTIAVRQSRLYQATQAQVTELEFLNQIKDDFLGTVSNELRVPITNVKVASQMLDIVVKQYNLNDSRIDRYMGVLQEECQQEINLINDLLDLQELEAGTRSLNFIEINLQNWLPRAVQPFLDRIQASDRTLILNIPNNLPLLTTDLSSLQRILVELLHNACTYTPSGETIEISADAVLTTQDLPVISSTRRISYRSSTEAVILLSVCNTGVEIPTPEQSRVFDKFYRSIGIERWHYGGTGLGLALVKRLTEHIGGTIELISDQNQTCFLIELPITPTGKPGGPPVSYK